MWSTSSVGGATSGSGPYSGGMKGDLSMGGELCRFFLNGGCIRGDACPYLHELPDERHLDVNGVGFIFTSGVQNSGIALQQQRRFQQPQSSPQQPPSYHGRQASPPPQGATSSGAQPNQPLSGPGAPRTPLSAAPGPYIGAPPFNPSSAPMPLSNGAPGPMHFQPPSNMYSYGPGTATDLRPPPQSPIMPGQAYVASPPMHLQPRSGTTAPITVVPQLEPGPYNPPTPFAYALPPLLTLAYQHAALAPVSPFAQPAAVFSLPAQQATIYTTLMPSVATA